MTCPKGENCCASADQHQHQHQQRASKQTGAKPTGSRGDPRPRHRGSLTLWITQGSLCLLCLLHWRHPRAKKRISLWRLLYPIPQTGSGLTTACGEHVATGRSWCDLSIDQPTTTYHQPESVGHRYHVLGADLVLLANVYCAAAKQVPREMTQLAHWLG